MGAVNRIPPFYPEHSLSRLRILLQIAMTKFLLWCILLFLCWPLALFALILYPIVWILLLPFRLLGVAVGGVLELIGGIIALPVRLMRRAV